MEGDLRETFQNLRGSDEEDRVRLFTEVPGRNGRQQVLAETGEVWIGLKKNISIMRTVKQWKSLPSKAVQFFFLRCFLPTLEKAQSNLV